MSTKQSIKALTKTSKKNNKTDSDISISDNNLVLPDVKNKLFNKDNNNNGRGQDNNCIVCNKNYNSTDEDWYQCKVCSGWAHDSCGTKGKFHYFCQKCF